MAPVKGSSIAVGSSAAAGEGAIMGDKDGRVATPVPEMGQQADEVSAVFIFERGGGLIQGRGH